MAPPVKRPGLSLYGNLLGGDASDNSNVISSAPVTYTPEQQAEMVKKKTDAPFGNFKPRISRPQQQQKARVKQALPTSSVSTNVTTATVSLHKSSSSTVTEGSSFIDPSPDKGASRQPASNFQKTTFDDFMSNEQYDDVDYDPQHRRGKGGRNKRRKKDNPGEVKHVWSWDDIYDPAFPSKYGDFKGSDEQVKANGDWKARLYHKKLKEAERRRLTGGMVATRYSEEPDTHRDSKPANKMFAPPPALLSFAPPTFEDERSKPINASDDDTDDFDPYAQSERISHIGSRAPPTFTSSSDRVEGTTESNSYLSRIGPANAARPEMEPVITSSQPSLTQARASVPLTDIEKAAKIAEAKVKIEAFKKKLAAQQAEAKPKLQSPPRVQESLPDTSSSQLVPPSPVTRDIQSDGPESGLQQTPTSRASSPVKSGGFISRAPVRYDIAAASTESDDHTAPVDQPEEAPKTKKPGQKGFAQRILEKQGWQKGQGLGAQGQGITTAIFAQAQKRKKRSDAEGGGWEAPANMGRIVGGKKAKVDGVAADEPQPSVVVKYTGLLAGLDATEEISENDLYQRIGETMNEKFGTVERIYVWLTGDNEVFIKFTDGMGALRATTNAFSFKGNTVLGQYFPEDKFEDGEYN